MSAWKLHVPGDLPVRLPDIKTYAPTFERPVYAVLLGELCWQRGQHWDDGAGHGVLCSGAEACDYCFSGRPTYFTGWATIWNIDTKRRGIMHMTERALAQYDEGTAGKSPLRGLRVKGQRADRRKASPMNLTVHSRWEDGELPPDFDPRPHLERMWGLAQLRRMRCRAGDQGDDQQRQQREA